MKRQHTKIVTMGLAVVSLLLGAGVMLAAGLRVQPAAQPKVAAIPAVEFIAIDVFVDAGEVGLAAWQIEYTGTSDAGEVFLVGIEGGEHAAYAVPPHYDPAALAGGRVILAAYTTGDALPVGASRIARLHLQVPVGEAKNELNHEVRLIAAGDEHGKRLTGRAWAELMSVDEKKPDDSTSNDSKAPEKGDSE